MAKTATYCLFAGNASQKATYLVEPSSEHKRLLCCSKTNSGTTNLDLNIFDTSSDQLTCPQLPTAGRFRDQKELSYAYTGRARSGAPQPPAQFAHLSARCASREPFHDGDLFCGAVSSLWITLCYLGHGAGRAVGQETGVNMRRAVKKEGRTCKKRSWWTDEQTTSEKSR